MPDPRCAECRRPYVYRDGMTERLCTCTFGPMRCTNPFNDTSDPQGHCFHDDTGRCCHCSAPVPPMSADPLEQQENR